MTNLVDQITKIIEPGAYFEGWFDERGKPAKLPKIVQSRLNYRKAEAAVKARSILMLIANVPASEIRQDLIKNEIAGWKSMGVPADDPELTATIERKYQVPA